MSPQAPRIGLATVTKVSFSLGGMGGTHCVLSLTQPSGKSDSSGLLRHGRGRGIGIGVCAGSSEVQAVPCGLQNSVWDIPWLGLASSWTPGTGPIAAMAPSRNCLEASVKTGQLSVRSCSNSSAEQNFSFVLVKGCQFGDCDYSDAWPKPWEPNSFGIASVTPSSDTNVRCVQAREDSTLWLNSSCVATALMANQLWRVQDAARATSAA